MIVNSKNSVGVILLISLVLAFLSNSNVNANLDPGTRSPLVYHVVTDNLHCSYECDASDVEMHDRKVKEIVNKINTDHNGYARIEKVNITPNQDYHSDESYTVSHTYTVIYSVLKQYVFA